MDKRKIKLDRPKISSEEIAKGMDFQAVLKGAGVAVKPWYKKAWFLGTSATTIVVLGTVVALYLNAESPKQSDTKPMLEQSVTTTSNPEEDLPVLPQKFIQKPFENLTVPKDDFTVNAAEGAKLYYKSGSTIEVPKNAFLDEAGQVIEGEVNIEYVEYHDPVDFFVSGIPMEYDSADAHYQFHSAGMLELVATQKGKPVYANPDNLIEVAIASQKEGNSFNVYYLDTANKNWSFMGKDQISPMATEMSTEQVLAVRESLNERYAKIVAAKPDKQVLVEQNLQKLNQEDQTLITIHKQLQELDDQLAEEALTKPQKPARFNLNYIEDEFPELSAFQNVKFEIGLEPENAHFSQEDYAVDWQDMKLTENEAGKNYLLTLIAEDLTKSYIVYPVADGVAKTEATLEYEKQLAAYETSVTKKQLAKGNLVQQEEAQMISIRKRNEPLIEQLHQQELEKWEAELAALTDEREAFEESLKKAAQLDALVQRTFKISQFGVWNCDQPVEMNPVNTIAASFANEAGEELSLFSVHLVDASVNGVTRYGKHDFGTFKYNPSVKNTLWAVTLDQQMAWCDDQAFESVKDGDEHQFTLKTSTRQFNSVADLRAFLEQPK